MWKHFALLTAIASLQLGELETLLYRESHSGCGEYVLPDKGEWLAGIGCMLPIPADLARHPYFTQFSMPLAPGVTYLGSWLQVGNYLSKRNVRFSIEIHDTSAQVAAAIIGLRQPLMAPIKFSPTNGFDAVLDGPPAGFSFIDPPYYPKSRPDWRKAAKCASALRAGKLQFMIWYPIYWPTEPNALVQAAGTKGFEVLWDRIGARPSQIIKGCGVVADGETTQVLDRHGDNLQSLAQWLGGELSERVAT